ncbi:alpha 1,2 mannosyltransferase [Coemansia sp. RSA 2598]|nr:alpha 1,2 mannosyltransferase [Coemansia sp. RSA 2598]
MPALFGPLLFLAIAGLWVAVKRRGRSQLSYLDACATASVLSGLGLLSLAPHQEPRFMVPALSGMVIASWRWHRAAPRYFWWLWAVFNLVLALAYGVVHQAGVVPAARYLAETSVFGSPVCRRIAGSPADAVCAPQSSGAAGEASDGRWAAANVTTRALFYASYPAPRHLLTQHSHRADQQLSRVKLTDLIMMEDEEVRSVLSAQPLVRCALAAGTDNGLVFTQTEQGGFERSLLAVPASADLARIRPPGSSLALLPIFRYQPHVNFDHIGEVVQKPMDRSTFNVFLMCQK